MQIIIAPDSFKGSLSSTEVAEAMKRGVLEAFPKAQVQCIPMADGGEGTVDALLMACGGDKIYCKVNDPLGREIESFYGLLHDGTAVIEMAAASGLPLIPPQLRNPMITTSIGTGQLILHAVQNGCKNFILGLGGSATNDGGMGLLHALGARFLDAYQLELPCCGASLAKIASVDISRFLAGLGALNMIVACDVDNPMCGNRGASAVFGPQKGARPEMIAVLDEGMRNWATVINETVGADVVNVPGSGAAGGIGGALMAFFNAQLLPGTHIVMQHAQFENHLRLADLVLTGEGCTDIQTTYGKVPVGIASVAQQHQVPVVCISGMLDSGYEAIYNHGITAAFSIIDRPMVLEEAMTAPQKRITNKTRDIIRLFQQGY